MAFGYEGVLYLYQFLDFTEAVVLFNIVIFTLRAMVLLNKGQRR
jgi:hypothetical protein